MPTKQTGLYGVNISRELAKRLRRYCKQSDRKVGATVERAVNEYLDKQENAVPIALSETLDRR